jgi:hypothetical protein
MTLSLNDWLIAFPTADFPGCFRPECQILFDFNRGFAFDEGEPGGIWLRSGGII